MGLKKYIITGHVIEVYEYKNYIHGKGGAKVKVRNLSYLLSKLQQANLLIVSRRLWFVLE